MSKMTKEQKIEAYEKMVAQRQKHTAKRLAKISVILRKAEAAGITATEVEIEEEMRRPKK